MTASTLRTTFSAVALSAAMLAGTAPVVADDDMEGNDGDARLVIYFTRHAEKQTVSLPAVTPPADNVVQVYTSMLENVSGALNFMVANPTADPIVTTDKGAAFFEVCGTSKCAEELSEQGEQRALLLADWFADRGITDELDAVYATHKTRTQQTVFWIADDAKLDVIVLDPESSELSPESTSTSECSTLQAIERAQADGLDTVVIAGHSGTLYDIMGNGVVNCDGEFYSPLSGMSGLGLDTGNTEPGTGNPDRFPKDSKGKVRDFGDLWKVVIRRNGEVRFAYRVNLQQPDRLKVVNIAR